MNELEQLSILKDQLDAFCPKGLTSTMKYNFDNIEKALKALEIIKDKKVDVKYLCYRAEFNVEKYNDNYIETLTQEEFNLLKEILIDE